MTQDEIKKWHDEENKWWDKYADIMSEQWQLNTNINSIIRKDMEESYSSFLYKKEGLILDVGCGSGWLALNFARQGMYAVGIDFSQEQIAQANTYKNNLNLNSVHFICSDFVLFESSEYIEKFDAVFVNAFLHHLPAVELEKIFQKISQVSKKHAKIYLYEPLMFNHTSNRLTKFMVSLYTKILSMIMWRLPSFFNIWNTKFSDALNTGYNGMSPNERSISFEKLKTILEKENISVITIKPEHYQSLPYAILAFSMRKPYSVIYTFFLSFVYRIDKLIFKIFNWKTLGTERNFLLCSVQLEKL